MKFLVLLLSLITTSLHAAEPGCDGALLLTNPITLSGAIEDLKLAIDQIPGGGALRERSWYQLMTDYARASEGDHNLVVASIIGGGNAGKSSLFNSLSALIAEIHNLHLEKPLSSVGTYPGLTRRMVLALNPQSPPWVATELRHRFGDLEPWTNAEDSQTPGPGLLAPNEQIPSEMAFIDSPDFDTGTAEAFEPDNLRRALRVIYPSDILIALVDARTVRNQANVKLLSSAFKLYGNKKLILVYLADVAVPEGEVRSQLLNLAHSLYGTQDTHFPDGVIGAYIMPYSGGVAAGRDLVELTPLRGFPTFSELTRHISADPVAIKRYAQRSATATILQGASEFLRAHYKRLEALRVYEKGIAALARLSGKRSVGDFNYLEVRDVLRNKFRAFDGQWRSLLYQFGSVAAIPDQLLVNLFSHFRPTSIIAKRVAADHRMHDRLAVTQMLTGLQNERVPLPADDHDEITTAFREASEKFYADFPEESHEEVEGQIFLPPARLLPESVRRELQRLVTGDSEDMIARLGDLIDGVQFDPRETLSRHDLNSVMGKVHLMQSRWRAGYVGFLDFTTLAAPATTSYWLMQHGISNTLIYLAVIIGSARPLRWWSDRAVDKYLQTEINRWYHALQFEATEVYFSETLAGPLRSAVAREISIYEGPEYQRLASALDHLRNELNISYSAP